MIREVIRISMYRKVLKKKFRSDFFSLIRLGKRGQKTRVKSTQRTLLRAYKKSSSNPKWRALMDV